MAFGVPILQIQIFIAIVIDDATYYTVPDQKLLLFVFYFKHVTYQKFHIEAGYHSEIHILSYTYVLCGDTWPV
jgi:hypothetical protein